MMINRQSNKHIARGSALIAVFWIMAVLSLAVFAAVRVVYHDADVASSQVNGFEALQAAERGIAVAVNPAVKWAIAASSPRPTAPALS